MTRVKISVGILLLLIGVSIFSAVTINIKCKEMTANISEVFEFSELGEKEKAFEASQRLCTDWENFHKLFSVMIKNEKLSEIDRVCATIPYLIENDSDELQSELTELRHMVDTLRQGETPHWISVF